MWGLIGRIIIKLQLHANDWPHVFVSNSVRLVALFGSQFPFLVMILIDAKSKKKKAIFGVQGSYLTSRHLPWVETCQSKQRQRCLFRKTFEKIIAAAIERRSILS